jgi:hypothetical protein
VCACVCWFLCAVRCLQLVCGNGEHGRVGALLCVDIKRAVSSECDLIPMSPRVSQGRGRAMGSRALL